MRSEDALAIFSRIVRRRIERFTLEKVYPLGNTRKRDYDTGLWRTYRSPYRSAASGKNYVSPRWGGDRYHRGTMLPHGREDSTGGEITEEITRLLRKLHVFSVTAAFDSFLLSEYLPRNDSIFSIWVIYSCVNN